MTVIVTDSGFSPDTFQGETIENGDVANVPTAPYAIRLPSDTTPEALTAELHEAAMIVIDFPSFADGRGFTLAKRLRLNGYSGRLRAQGHVLADQYAMARRSGFDEVAIDDALADRQPEPQWLARAGWQDFDYRKRLAGAGAA